MMRQTEAAAGFDEILRSCILNSMSTVLGNTGMQATAHYIGEGALSDARRFHARAVEIFGPGSASLETVILNQLSMRLGAVLPGRPSRDFVRGVELIQREFGPSNGRTERSQR